MSKYFSSVAKSFPDVKSKYFDYDKSSKCIKRMLPKEKGTIVVQFIEKAISDSLIGDKRVKELVDKAFEKLYEKKHKKSYKKSIKKAKELHKTYKIKVKDLKKAPKPVQKNDKEKKKVEAKKPKQEKKQEQKNKKIEAPKKTALQEAEELFAKMPHEIANLVGSYLIEDILKEVNYNLNDKRIEGLKDMIQIGGESITSLDIEDPVVTYEQLQEIVKTFPNLEKLHFVLEHNENHDQIAKLLSELKDLKDLEITPEEITHLSFTDAGFEHLSKLTKLERLSLDYCKDITDQAVLHLSALTELTSFAIRGYSLTDQSLEYIGKLNKLTSLRFDTNTLSAAGLQHLAHLDLRTLEIGGGIQNDDVQPIAAFTHLQSLALNLEGDGACLQHLAPLENLEHLDLSRSIYLSNESMQHIAQLKKLKTLKLLSENAEFNDDCLVALSALSELRILEIDGVDEITSKGLKALAKLSKLSRLKMELDTKTAKELHRLKGLSKLKDLELEVEDINDEILQAIATITSLVKLKLRECDEVTDKGMEHISRLPKLKKLSLYILNDVTDKGIQHLMKCHLQKFTVSDAVSVSKNALKALKKQGTQVTAK